MLLKDVKGIIVDEICIYVEVGEMEYKDVYRGRLCNVSEGLLMREIRVIGAKRKNLVDIEII